MNSGKMADPGFWIGFFETILSFVFVIEREYGPLALIFVAKQFLPKEWIEKNPTYYRVGSLINITLAVLFGIIARSFTGL